MEKKRNRPNSLTWCVDDQVLYESYEPALFNDWIIKTSTYGDQIQMFAYNIESGHTIIRWFDEKADAGLWLEHLCDL